MILFERNALVMKKTIVWTLVSALHPLRCLFSASTCHFPLRFSFSPPLSACSSSHRLKMASPHAFFLVFAVFSFSLVGGELQQNASDEGINANLKLRFGIAKPEGFVKEGLIFRWLARRLFQKDTDSAGEAQGVDANITSMNNTDTIEVPAPHTIISPAKAVENSSVSPESTGLNTTDTTEGNTTDARETNGTQSDTNSSSVEAKLPSTSCDGSLCVDPKKVVTACLHKLDDGTYNFSLSIMNGGVVPITVRIATPETLKAEESELVVKSGTPKTVRLLSNPMMDTEVVDSGVKHKNITINSIHGECIIEIPTKYYPKTSPVQGYSRYSSFLTPAAGGLLLLVFVCMGGAGMLLCKYRRKKRLGDSVKYQQIEMNATSMGTPKEREEETVEGWDEMWDDWEDTEAGKSSSRLTQNLSSRGLAARRGNKDSRDNAWDD